MNGWTVVRKFTDECTTCDVCGKIELRGTVHLVHEDGSEIFAGTTCAARKVGVKAEDIRSAVKSAEILEDQFCADFKRRFGVHPAAHIREHGDAGRRGVDLVRMQFLRNA